MGNDFPFFKLFLASVGFFFVVFAAVLLLFWYRSRMKSGGKKRDILSSVHDLEKKGGLTPEEMKKIRAAMAEKLKESNPEDLL